MTTERQLNPDNSLTSKRPRIPAQAWLGLGLFVHVLLIHPALAVLL